MHPASRAHCGSSASPAACSLQAALAPAAELGEVGLERAWSGGTPQMLGGINIVPDQSYLCFANKAGLLEEGADLPSPSEQGPRKGAAARPSADLGVGATDVSIASKETKPSQKEC